MEKYTKLISTFFICITILIGFWFFSAKDFYIKQMPDDNINRTIGVYWDGKVFVQPDLLTFDIEISDIQKNSTIANDNVKNKLKQIHKIFDNIWLDKNYIQTKNISLYPEYDYKLWYSKLLGYKSVNILEIKIKKINTDNVEKWPKIIESILAFSWVKIDNIKYDLEDKTEVYTKAREMAVQKAKQKAKEMTDLVGIKLWKPISIQEENSRDNPIYYGWYGSNIAQQNVYQVDMVSNSNYTEPTNDNVISIGQLNFSSKISIIYSID